MLGRCSVFCGLKINCFFDIINKTARKCYGEKGIPILAFVVMISRTDCRVSWIIKTKEGKLFREHTSIQTA